MLFRSPTAGTTNAITASITLSPGVHVLETWMIDPGGSRSLALAYSPDIQLTPLLAEKWEISPDAKTYTFTLRKGVKFQNLPPVNGRELTSADVKFSYEYSSRTGQFKESKLPPGKFVQYFEGLEKIETPDANTAVVTFSKPFAPFLSNAAEFTNPIMPKEIYDQDGNFTKKLVGTGPFQVDEIGRAHV